MTSLTATNYWVIAGLALLTGEMLTGGFFLVFIAIGCFAASLATTVHQSLLVQMITCAVVSIVGVTALRKTLQKRFLKSIPLNSDVGREIQIDQDIQPHKRARITYQGTTWEAVNIGDEGVRTGDQVMIVGVDGIVLLIRKVN